MQKNRRYAILILLISALLVSVLFNLRIFLWVIETGITNEIRPRLYYLFFNFIIEFAVFVLAGMLNYAWIKTLLQPLFTSSGHPGYLNIDLEAKT